MDRIEVKKIPQIQTTFKMTSTKLLNHILQSKSGQRIKKFIKKE